jgi:hypothetical protein
MGGDYMADIIELDKICPLCLSHLEICYGEYEELIDYNLEYYNFNSRLKAWKCNCCGRRVLSEFRPEACLLDVCPKENVPPYACSQPPVPQFTQAFFLPPKPRRSFTLIKGGEYHAPDLNH